MGYLQKYSLPPLFFKCHFLKKKLFIFKCHFKVQSSINCSFVKIASSYLLEREKVKLINKKLRVL